MKILVFEWCVGGGLADDHPLNSANVALLRQGRKMLSAVCEDFHTAGHQVSTPVDAKLDFTLTFPCEQTGVDRSTSLPTLLAAMAADADAVLIIAPECDSIYANVCKSLDEHRHKFLGPDIDFVRLTGDKWACHRHLTAANVATPPTMLIPGGDTLDVGELGRCGIEFPIVIKPVDGAGSEGVHYAANESDDPAGNSAKREFDLCRFNQKGAVLVQSFVAGTPVSVSAIMSLNRPPKILPATGQKFDTDPIGEYVEALHPLPGDIADRAAALARHTLAALPPTRGYIGIDMVISDAGPSGDVVIEINPRLTLSYITLREIAADNLAAAMITAAD